MLSLGRILRTLVTAVIAINCFRALFSFGWAALWFLTCSSVMPVFCVMLVASTYLDRSSWEAKDPQQWRWLHQVVASIRSYASSTTSCASSFITRVNSPVTAHVAGRGRKIGNKYESIEDVQDDLRAGGLDCCSLIVGIDFTMSNQSSGKISYQGDSLHKLYTESEGKRNPYEQVIQTVMETLAPFDDDGHIPVYGFGDSETRDTGIFRLTSKGSGSSDVLQAYRETVRRVRLSGPTSFAPLIEHAVQLVKDTGRMHMLLIIADGQMSDMQRDLEAIKRASHVPLSIVCVGVGDGPWDQMSKLDDYMPKGRRFDNFQFVHFESVQHPNLEVQRANFACQALMELPAQHAEIKKLGLLKRVS